MSKYIDADKLIAEIERRLSKYDPDYTNAGSELKELLSFIRSLQQEQPEVDSLIRSELPDMEDDKSLGLCHCNQFGNHRITSKDVREIARHFYELGLNARKEE